MLFSVKLYSAVKNKPYYLTPLLCLLCVSLLNACGFKLRGAVELSSQMSPLYLKQNSLFALARQIKPLLASSEITVTDRADEANAYLSLNSEQKKRRVLSVDSNGRAREYSLSYTVFFTISLQSSAAAKTKAIEDSVSLSRSLIFDPDAVLAVANESEILYKDMQRDAARLILLKLQAYSKSRDVSEKVDQAGGSARETVQ